MDPPPRLKALLQVVLLLWSAGAGWLQGERLPGEDLNLQCVNDYLYTINCTLDIAPPEDASVSSRSYWLTITDLYENSMYLCPLENTTEGYFCSVNKLDETPDVDTFTDVDAYSIALCQDEDGGSESCEGLEDEYEPVSHIKPNAPCCLAVGQNSSRLLFTWRSSYEDYSSFTELMKDLQYQLLIYETDDTHKAGTYVNTDDTLYSVDRRFLPDEEYAARVRSSPNMVHYQGQWSDWSSEVLWRTDPAVEDDGHIPYEDADKPALMFAVPMVIGGVCVVVVIILVLYYGPIKMWRQSTFIPTPAPYFHSLYRDYQGDFKSWVVTQDNTVDALKAEETLKIDILVQSVDAPQQWWTEAGGSGGYRNVPSPDCAVADYGGSSGAPYTDSSWLSARGSSGGAWSEPGSPARDLGCWLCSDTSLEREPPWYCNEYCTLSCVQQRLSGAPQEA
ncbi:interleukin-21 receptor isoform X1 [Kryptolebias marmoratus]|uniref:Interleukin-21 receptor-like n=1 Tax=Kryptolebias marmoratus TaxID=37003 RepID=A0A3Q3AJ58_KRYMA|nr:interleukin-21 receptor isoform X1 [Kryptolebias marmoratus]